MTYAHIYMYMCFVQDPAAPTPACIALAPKAALVAKVLERCFIPQRLSAIMLKELDFDNSLEKLQVLESILFPDYA